eukprot:scaffold7924_cov267-Pinguiococcus_pyrenoidosus.AAC.1
MVLRRDLLESLSHQEGADRTGARREKTAGLQDEDDHAEQEHPERAEDHRFLKEIPEPVLSMCHPYRAKRRGQGGGDGAQEDERNIKCGPT